MTERFPFDDYPPAEKPQGAVNPLHGWKRFTRSLPRVHAYQLPGYGVTYRSLQRFIHARGRCVLARGPVMDDGRRLWKCSWCGHRIAEPAPFPVVIP